MKTLLSLLFVTFLFYNTNAQNEGVIDVVVYSEDSTEVVPFSSVWISKNDSVISGVKSNIQGKTIINCVAPGYYSLHVEQVMYGYQIFDSILILFDSTIHFNVYLKQKTMVICGGLPNPPEPFQYIYDYEDYTLKQFDQVLIGIESVGFEENTEIVTGGRLTDDIMFIVDGLPYRDMNKLPLMRINSIKQFVNGLPAKYGDTTSEVILIQTKGYFDLYYEWKSR